MAAVIAALAVFCPSAASAGDLAAARFEERIQPILEEYCYGCHGNGLKKGGIRLDGFDTDAARLNDHDLWWAVLKNLRAGIMPPAGKPRPTEQERGQIEELIRTGAFGINPADPDPGRVTVRRLNRVEYRNTIRDLM
ncbi:MAG TPA: c-type cytochrome domain-containing protein, partial [Isosphaeraceae bacterium]|nr:c-type cytochrome domain-containing protein [Isosphaeraceae bacterium]